MRTTAIAGPRGYDGSKKINGRKRHVLVDTIGLVLNVKVHEANIQDRAGAPMVFEPLIGRLPRLELVWADGGYTGELESWLRARLGWLLEIVQHPWQGWQGTWLPAGAPPPLPVLKPRGFVVLKRRWVVERTFAWLGRSRRLSWDYEVLPEAEESWVYACMTRLMVRRLARMAS